MAGFIASFSGSLRTLIGWRGRSSGVLVDSSAARMWPQRTTEEQVLGWLKGPESSAAKAEESVMANKFVTVMEAIGRDFVKGLEFVGKYLPGAAALAALIFPGTAAVDAEVVAATGLVSKAVALVEQRYAASGAAKGTGAQKLAEVLTLTEQAVTALLAKAGITADTEYVTKIVNAVVAILNVQTATVAS